MSTVSQLPGTHPTDAPPPGLLRLAWPIFAEQSLHMLTNVVSTLMASRIGDNAVAGLGSAGQILVMFLIGFNVLAVGASIATTHHLGLDDRAPARWRPTCGWACSSACCWRAPRPRCCAGRS